MYNNRRLGKIRRKNPLIFRNPFRSGYVTNEPKLIVAPIRREGITSIENAERERVQKRFSELGNAGMLKQMKEYGMIPDDFQVDMAKFTGNSAVTPQGVASLEQVAKEGDAARQIERMNAGILSEEERKRRILYELAEKRKREQGIEKTIQWLATTDELDEVPIEFQEEVDKYYTKMAPDQVAAIKDARKKLKDEKQKKEDEKRMRQKYWESKPGWDFISPQPGESYRYSDNPSIPIRNDSHDKKGFLDTFTAIIQDDRITSIKNGIMKKRDQIKSTEDIIKREMSWFNSPDADKSTPQIKAMHRRFLSKANKRKGELEEQIRISEEFLKKLINGNGAISVNQRKRKMREAKYGIIRRRYDIPDTEGSGWRAPRLHNLVRPLKKFNMGETAEQVVGEQKDALDERRSKFKEQAMFQRGVYPSKDVIESAFPKTVEPFIPEPRDIPKTGLILHPFIFPSKKYMVKTGVF